MGKADTFRFCESSFIRCKVEPAFLSFSGVARIKIDEASINLSRVVALEWKNQPETRQPLTAATRGIQTLYFVHTRQASVIFTPGLERTWPCVGTSD
jgi:hypothetical protein